MLSIYSHPFIFLTLIFAKLYNLFLWYRTIIIPSEKSILFGTKAPNSTRFPPPDIPAHELFHRDLREGLLKLTVKLHGKVFIVHYDKQAYSDTNSKWSTFSPYQYRHILLTLIPCRYYIKI